MSDDVFNLPGAARRVHIVDMEQTVDLKKRIAALETELRQAVAERDDYCAEATEWKSIIQRKGYDVVVLNTWRRERDIAQADARALAEALNRFDGADTDELPFIADDAMSVLQEHGAKYLETQP